MFACSLFWQRLPLLHSGISDRLIINSTSTWTCTKEIQIPLYWPESQCEVTLVSVPTVTVCCCKVCRWTAADRLNSKCRWGLTWFVGTWWNILESCALSKNTEFAVAVFTIKFLCLTIGEVLMITKDKNRAHQDMFQLFLVTFHTSDSYRQCSISSPA